MRLTNKHCIEKITYPIKQVGVIVLLLFALTLPEALFCHSIQADANGGQYDREAWPHWVDADKDCQDTRAEILIRDNEGTIKFKRNKPCNVSWGKWRCPYTGKVFTKASDLDIDHIVPLAHAHRTGGASWSRAKKEEFANDPMNLLAVEDNTNQSKSDKGPDEWKPPLKSFWAEYAARWRKVKQKYGLSINVEEEKHLRLMEK